MKSSNRFFATAMAVCLLGGQMSAKDIYLSADGNDANDGLSAVKAVKTLSRVNEIIQKKDVIHVSGMIDMSEEVPDGFDSSVNTDWKTGGVWASANNGGYVGFNISSRDNTQWQGITFIGADPAVDGFDGKELVPHFIVRGKNENGTTFKNIGFINGISNKNGGTLVFRDEAVVTFENCQFVNNHPDWSMYALEGNTWKAQSGASEKGGAIRSEGNCSLNFKKCLFENNINRQGGAMFLSGTAKDRTRSGFVSLYDCVFRNNSAYGCVDGIEDNVLDNTKGAAIAVYALNNEVYLDIDHCLFEGNRTKNEAGAIWIYDNTKYGHYCDINISNSAFYENESNMGGAMEICHTNSLFDDKDYVTTQQIKIVNTTFCHNKAKAEGGAILFYGASTNLNHENYPKTSLTMVNCTLVANYTDGNGGHGAGYCEKDYGENGKIDYATRKFYNCIFEGNLALNNGNKQEISDFTTFFLGQTVENCYVGRFFVRGGTSVEDFVSALNGGNGAASSVHGYSGENIDGSNTFYLAGDEHAANIFDYTRNNVVVVPFIPLPAGSELKTAGNTKWLTCEATEISNPAKDGVAHPCAGYDISKSDQLGFPRSNEKCAVGASEAMADDIMENYLDGDKDLPYNDNGESATNVTTISTQYSIIRNGNIITAPDSQITIVDINGRCVMSGIGSVDISSLAQGVYIVTAADKTIRETVKIMR